MWSDIICTQHSKGQIHSILKVENSVFRELESPSKVAAHPQRSQVSASHPVTTCLSAGIRGPGFELHFGGSLLRGDLSQLRSPPLRDGAI